MTETITRDVAIVTDRWCLAQVCGSVAPRMSVAGSPRRSPSCRWRRRHRPGADWWGPSVRLIVDQGCGYSFTCFGTFLLVVVLWCVRNPDLWDRGLVCFWGTFLLWLVYPNLPIAWAQARARITHTTRWQNGLPCEMKTWIKTCGPPVNFDPYVPCKGYLHVEVHALAVEVTAFPEALNRALGLCCVV